MKHTDRLRRPTMSRTDPVRSFSTLFRAPAAGAPDNGANGGAQTEPNGAPSLGDVVAHSVDVGYRIIDDYIQQGEKAARRLSERSTTPQTMVSDAQDVAMRFAQHASSLAAVWLEFLQLTAASSGVPVASTLWNPFTPAAGKTTEGVAAGLPPHVSAQRTEPQRTRVRIEIVSSQPAQVQLDLQPGAPARALTVHELRAVDPNTPRLGDVTFHPESNGTPACLRIHIPAGQPAGIYNGLIIDEASSRPVGSVSVSLTNAGTAPAT